MAYAEKEYKRDHNARAMGRSLGISTKQTIELANAIRNKSVAKAKNLLNDVVNLKRPVKFTRFTNGAGHKRGIGPGKYPINAARGILGIIEAVEANAQFKGLNTSDLQIKRLIIQNAGNVFRYGRQRRRRMKRTHVEILVEEGKDSKKATAKSPEKPKIEPKSVDMGKATKPAAVPKKESAKPAASDNKKEEVKKVEVLKIEKKVVAVDNDTKAGKKDVPKETTTEVKPESKIAVPNTDKQGENK